MPYEYKKGQRATRETIAEEQARLKKEPYMINAETWSYVVEPKININNGKIIEEKQKQKQKNKTKKYSHKKRK